MLVSKTMKGLRIKTYLKANMLVEHMTALSQKHTTVNYTQNYQWSEQNVFFLYQLHELQYQLIKVAYVKEKLALDKFNRRGQLCSQLLQKGWEKSISKYSLHLGASVFFLWNSSWEAKRNCSIPAQEDRKTASYWHRRKIERNCTTRRGGGLSA